MTGTGRAAKLAEARKPLRPSTLAGNECTQRGWHASKAAVTSDAATPGTQTKASRVSVFFLSSSAVDAWMSVASQPSGSRGGHEGWPSLTNTPTRADMARLASLRMRSCLVDVCTNGSVRRLRTRPHDALLTRPHNTINSVCKSGFDNRYIRIDGFARSERSRRAFALYVT